MVMEGLPMESEGVRVYGNEDTKYMPNEFDGSRVVFHDQHSG